MIIQYASDFHLDSTPGAPPLRTEHLACDVLVLAGDIDHRPGQLASYAHWLSTSRKPRIPVVVVLGNHDYYTHDLHTAPEAFREAFRKTGNPDLHLLENETIEIAPEGLHDGVVFIGGTLWDSDYRSPEEEETSDYCNIMVGGRCMRITDRFDVNNRSRTYVLDTLLSKTRQVDPYPEPPVVCVTHFPPDDDLVRGLAAAGDQILWIHGHTHETVRKEKRTGLFSVRIRSNPWGGTDEYCPNPQWDPSTWIRWQVPYFDSNDRVPEGPFMETFDN